MTMYGTVAVHVLGLAGVVDRDDRRVVQRRGGLRLAAEPGLERGVAGEVGAQHLDRDVPAEPEVAAAVHLGHAAVAERLADLVPGSQQAWRRHRTLVVIEPIETSVFQSRLSAEAATGRAADRASVAAALGQQHGDEAGQDQRQQQRQGDPEWPAGGAAPADPPGGRVQPAAEGVGVHCGYASAGLVPPTPSGLTRAGGGWRRGRRDRRPRSAQRTDSPHTAADRACLRACLTWAWLTACAWLRPGPACRAGLTWAADLGLRRPPAWPPARAPPGRRPGRRPAVTRPHLPGRRLAGPGLAGRGRVVGDC